MKSICWWGAATTLNYNKTTFGRDVLECCQAEAAAQPCAMAKSEEGDEGRSSRARTSQASGKGVAEKDRQASRHRHCCSLDKKGTGGAGPGQQGRREPCAHAAAAGKVHDLFLIQLLLKEPTNRLLRGKRRPHGLWLPTA